MRALEGCCNLDIGAVQDAEDRQTVRRRLLPDGMANGWGQDCCCGICGLCGTLPFLRLRYTSCVSRLSGTLSHLR